MYKITIEGENMTELVSEVLALAATFVVGAPTPAEVEATPAAKPTRKTKAVENVQPKDTPPTTEPVTPAEPEAKDEPVEEATTEPKADAATIKWDGSVESVRAVCMKLGEKNMDTLRNVLIEAGSPKGGWSGVPVEKYGEVFIRATDLLERADD